MSASILRPLALVCLLSIVACGDDDGSGTSSGTTSGTTSSTSSGTGGGGGTGGAGSSSTTGTGGNGGNGGDGGAGTEPSPECAVYCDEFISNCTTIAGVEAYADEPDCLQTCAGFAHGAPDTFMGDSVECRVNHLTFEPNPGPGYYELHCFHAQEHPTENCVP